VELGSVQTPVTVHVDGRNVSPRRYAPRTAPPTLAPASVSRRLTTILWPCATRSTIQVCRCILAPVGALPKRISIPDARGTGASLRVTRHAQERKVVLSHWRDGVCVASTPIDLGEIPALIGVLAQALGDGTTISAPPSATHDAPSLWSSLRGRFRPSLAKVVELSLIRELQRERTAE